MQHVGCVERQPLSATNTRTKQDLQLGKNRHCMTFPVDQGQNMSFLAYVTNDRGGWPSDKTQCLPTTKAEALDDFRAFGPNVKHIIKLAVGAFERVS